jgi:predicted PhzF superfamily epimerase YddE/YHI9
VPVELVVVDAFTEEAFAGNPAAIAVLDRFPPDAWMQLVAREMNLSETAFAVPRGGGEYDLRWFTPTTEVDLCGHATLATAAVVGPPAVFHTRSGPLPAGLGPAGRIELDFPADPTSGDDHLPPVPPGIVVDRRRGRQDLLVEVSDLAWLRAHQPDIPAILALECRALIVTAASDREGVDFESRVFCPAVGVAEDPVTGSAHCTLAGYWADRLGRRELVGYQASARGGTVHVRLAGDRVVLGGSAVTVSRVTVLA